MKEGNYMTNAWIKNHVYNLMIDSTKKEFVVIKKSKLLLQTQRIIPFCNVKKIKLLIKNKELYVTFYIKNYSPYILTFPICYIDNNDFTVFMILLNNSHLLIEDTQNIIEIALKNDIDLKNL